MAQSKYYLPNGTRYYGKIHKMPNGSIHTGAKHSAKSIRLTTTKPKNKKKK